MNDSSKNATHQLEKSTVSSNITERDVQENRRNNIEVNQEKLEELVGCMKPELHGLLTADEFKDFQQYRTKFHHQILNSDSLKQMNTLLGPLKELLDYSVEVVGSTGVLVYLNLFKYYCKEPTEDQLEKAYFHAWALYCMHGIYMPLDDMVDRCAVRRFKPAYFVNVGRELTAMRILLLFQTIVAEVDKKFKNEPFGAELTQHWCQYIALATAAQTMDAQGSQTSEATWDFRFREDHNEFMTRILHDLPLQAAALMAGHELKPEDFEFWRSTMKAINNLMRNVNDFNDAFPAAPTGKPLYTDIVNGVGSWCSAKAWELANEEERKILEANYGYDDNQKIANVLQVYQQVNLKDHFERSNKLAAKQVLRLFQQCPDNLAPKDLLIQLFDFATAEHGLAWH